MRVPVTTPEEIMPNKIPGLECECQNHPVDLALALQPGDLIGHDLLRR